MTPSDLRLNGTVIRFDASVLKTLDPNLFDPSWLCSQKFWEGSTHGRSQAHFFHYTGIDMVLRHFHRGGLVGRLNRDLYLRVGAPRSRAIRECDLLADMHVQGLPVPLPVAARYVPFGPFYRADIITQRIPHADTLQDVISERALSDQMWTAIGASVRNLHNHGVFHSDLNCRNIMIDADERVWFIDFDKCEKRAPGAWKQANLDRLNRSLAKTAAGSENVHWHDAKWADFLVGYANGSQIKG